MKVQDMMSRQICSCQTDADLAAAAMMMWEKDCGVIPIVDANQKIVSVITDRDICMAVATQHKKAEEIKVIEVESAPAFTCRPGDEAKKALELMRDKKVRRIPVVDADNRLIGIISLNDFILAAEEKKTDAPSIKEVLSTLKSVCAHRTVAAAA